MDEARLTALLRRLERSCVVAPGDMVGCTAKEIEALEAKYQLQVPRTYRRYLEVMGHRSGRLFACDHAAVFYDSILAMTAEKRNQWSRDNAEDGIGPPDEFEFPTDALIINGRLGEQFEFIRCNNQVDSPVWYFNTYEWQVRQTEPSVLAWLESWCKESETAIADGYFEVSPAGTTP